VAQKSKLLTQYNSLLFLSHPVYINAKKLISLKHSVRATYVTPLKQQKSLCMQNSRRALTKRAAVMNICSTWW